MDIDRKLQNGLLKLLKIAYPQTLSDDELYWFYIEEQLDNVQTWDEMQDFIKKPKDGFDNAHLKANLAYLEEHALIRRLNGEYQATAKGIDLIANDGGLSAILQMQKVTLDAESLKPLVQALSQSQKQTMLAQVQSIPVEMLKEWLLEALV
ncbi:hypothetical protein ACSFCC_09460 [Glaesserella parasuis]|uniref:hypothetical protein n=1 Tax=Glaesserella parasuis TaxID=738 RepID=UPI0021BDC4E5|nr:hypothetical protein [Glaesserella parasuis]MCT8680166.1 hypothetical protein [Glaesserella parasuis]MCT8818068.1 hypothetical protein [Glaesserella parasuis]MDO9754606.1 hypothetical protein [Glaesserella parasuis]